ncbi:MAG: ABC transporter ATP-binding protein [Spirochaetaceae bacterium]|jgi:simple sugar transport system ATP-binding protein|nr:ABC transporter ATP-binding protein [Spirochaetaceae bacterium]
MSYIEMSHISKRFATVLANDDVSLAAERGEILALLGENGSGKSTLMNMLSGIYIPDAGSIAIGGRPCAFRSPEDAIAARVGMVHQHFKLIPVMTAWENIGLGERRGGENSFGPANSSGSFNSFGSLNPFNPFNPFIDKKRINQKITSIEQQFGLRTVHDKKVYDMAVSERQAVEILKVLYRGAEALILDEPTAVLTPQEIGSLFAMLRNMKAAGNVIIIITHKLNEVLEISDRVTVLRKGKAVGTVKTADTSARELTEMMVGASVSLEIRREDAAPHDNKAPVLEARSLNYRNAEGVDVLRDMSFSLYGGEILGVAGIAGSGQRELCEIIAGLRRAESGSILLQGENMAGLSPRAIKNRGVSMSFVPEDRLGMGLVAGMNITDNVLLRSYEKTPGMLVDRQEGRVLAEKIVERYDISTPSVSHPVRKLSGGNIQKVLLGREIELEPQVLITAYPVRGLDIGASYSIYDMLNEQKKKGVAILYLGEDLDVLMELCDRIMVIHAGAVMGTVDPRNSTKEDIGALMLGGPAGAPLGGGVLGTSGVVPLRGTERPGPAGQALPGKKAGRR